MVTSLDLKQRLISLGVATAEDIFGCTSAEIERLQRNSGLQLPSSYIEFLRIAGKGAGRFMNDFDIHFEHLVDLNERAMRKLDRWEEGKLKLPVKAFVFCMRYGEQFMFFVADGNQADPEIYHYYEGQGEFKKVANSFWEVIEGELLDLERFKRDHPDAPFWQ
jgi:hypothetical protein